MRVAVCYKTDNTVYSHYGKAEQFKLFDIENKKVVNSEILIVYKMVPTEVAKHLMKHSVDVVICGNIGDSAKETVFREGLILYGGVTGNCDEVIQDFINNKLVYDKQLAFKSYGEDGDDIPDLTTGFEGEDCACNHNNCCGGDNSECGCSDGGCSDGKCCGGCKK